MHLFRIHSLAFWAPLIILTLICGTAQARKVYSNVPGGQWEDAGSWLGNQVPISTDSVYIVPGSTVSRPERAPLPELAYLEVGTETPSTDIAILNTRVLVQGDVHFWPNSQFSDFGGNLRLELGGNLYLYGRVTPGPEISLAELHFIGSGQPQHFYFQPQGPRIIHTLECRNPAGLIVEDSVTIMRTLSMRYGKITHGGRLTCVADVFSRWLFEIVKQEGSIDVMPKSVLPHGMALRLLFYGDRTTDTLTKNKMMLERSFLREFNVRRVHGSVVVDTDLVTRSLFVMGYLLPEPGKSISTGQISTWYDTAGYVRGPINIMPDSAHSSDLSGVMGSICYGLPPRQVPYRLSTNYRHVPGTKYRIEALQSENPAGALPAGLRTFLNGAPLRVSSNRTQYLKRQRFLCLSHQLRGAPLADARVVYSLLLNGPWTEIPTTRTMDPWGRFTELVTTDSILLDTVVYLSLAAAEPVFIPEKERGLHILQIVPQPGQGSFSLTGLPVGEWSLTISNITGKVLQTQFGRGFIASFRTDLPPGSYFISCTQGTGAIWGRSRLLIE